MSAEKPKQPATQANDNEHSSTQSNPQVTPTKNATLGRKIICTLLSLVAIGLLLVLITTTGHFHSIFRTLPPEDLPGITQIAINMTPVYWLFLLVSGLPLFIWLGARLSSKTQQRLIRLAVICPVVAIVATLFTTIGIFSPVVFSN